MPDPGDFPIQSSANILGFVHCLRAAEFDVSTEDAALIGRALTGFSNPDLRLSRTTCRALCCRNKQEWHRFDALFDAYWFPQYGQDHETPESEMEKPSRSGGGLAGIGTGTDVFDSYKQDDIGVGAGAGRQTTLAKADFRFLNNRAAMRRIEELAECLAQQIRSRLSRRRELTRRAGQLAVRPTLRASVRTGGLPLQPWYARRRLQPPNLVVLHDVSHSMTFNNPLLFRFTRGLTRRFNSAEAFVFHTRLFRVTPIFRETSIARMREILEHNNKLWLGGTCIADSLAEFREQFARQTVKTDSLVIIISDGFDSNEPEQLATQLKWLRQRCRRVVWLNPMLERAGFNPEKEAVWNIRRNVDRLLPAHSLDALRRCVQALSQG
ncbi:MAG: VWA domain-containing protein [Arenicellales bacterium]|nr:VWA domain-containing protein [Arenicellales bacterium]